MAVWGIKAPPVCTANWDAAAWERYEDGFRPEGYTGGREDHEAWEAFLEREHQKNLRAFLARHGVATED